VKRRGQDNVDTCGVILPSKFTKEQSWRICLECKDSTNENDPKKHLTWGILQQVTAEDSLWFESLIKEERKALQTKLDTMVLPDALDCVVTLSEQAREVSSSSLVLNSPPLVVNSPPWL
jgi:hypothetical protein